MDGNRIPKKAFRWIQPERRRGQPQLTFNNDLKSFHEAGRAEDLAPDCDHSRACHRILSLALVGMNMKKNFKGWLGAGRSVMLINTFFDQYFVTPQRSHTLRTKVPHSFMF